MDVDEKMDKLDRCIDEEPEEYYPSQAVHVPKELVEIYRKQMTQCLLDSLLLGLHQ